MAVDVVVIDSGVANLGSVLAAFARAGIAARASAKADEIAAATHVVLPGVGAAAPAMRKLREAGLVDVVRGLKQPVLGICLGMQLLFEGTEEGDETCLGLIAGRVRKFDASRCGRVPHMGWNRLDAVRESPLTRDFGPEAYAYFVHSYAAPVGEYTLSTCDYGGAFSAIVKQNNFFGAQFHPERSAGVGARLLANFVMC